jgi:hypothetical protein
MMIWGGRRSNIRPGIIWWKSRRMMEKAMTKKRNFKASTCRKMEDIPIDRFLSYFIHSVFTLSLLSLFYSICLDIFKLNNDLKNFGHRPFWPNWIWACPWTSKKVG